jgi:hypothetical protein
MDTNTTNKGKRDEIKDILLKINMQTESRKKGGVILCHERM